MTAPTTTQAQLDQILRLTRDIQAALQAEHRADVLEAIREQVSTLSHGHEAIRDDIRDLLNLIVQQATSAAD